MTSCLDVSDQRTKHDKDDAGAKAGEKCLVSWADLAKTEPEGASTALSIVDDLPDLSEFDNPSPNNVSNILSGVSSAEYSPEELLTKIDSYGSSNAFDCLGLAFLSPSRRLNNLDFASIENSPFATSPVQLAEKFTPFQVPNTSQKENGTEGYQFYTTQFLQDTADSSAQDKACARIGEVTYECLDTSLESSLPTVAPDEAAFNRWHRCQARRRKRAKHNSVHERHSTAKNSMPTQSASNSVQGGCETDQYKSQFDLTQDLLPSSALDIYVGSKKSAQIKFASKESEKNPVLEQTISDLKQKIARLSQINRVLQLEMGRARLDASKSRMLAANLAAIGRMYVGRRDCSGTSGAIKDERDRPDSQSNHQKSDFQDLKEASATNLPAASSEAPAL